MLSCTGGYAKRSRVLGHRCDETTLRATLCPALRARGFCRAHQQEIAARVHITAEKEAELRRRATELCALQAEVLQSSGAAQNNASGEEAIARAVEELRAEPSYAQWSLEGAVAERMALRRQRRCPFSHHRAAPPRALRSARSGQSPHCPAAGAGGERADRAAAERRRAFAGLSPMQRCVVCLVWQGTCDVPREVLGANSTNAAKGGESYSDSEDDKEDNNNNNNNTNNTNKNNNNNNNNNDNNKNLSMDKEAVVTVTVARPALGVVDLSSLPALVAFVARRPERAVIRAETAAFFAADGAVIVPPSVTDKQVDLSTSAGAHELVDAIAWAVQLISERRGTHRSPKSKTHRSNKKNVSKGNQKHRHQGPSSKELNAEEEGEGNDNNDDDDNNDVFEEAEEEEEEEGGTDPFLLRSLTLRRCAMTSADALIGALRKRHFDATLLALDLSENRLLSLRCLFALRAHFSERLLRLSLADNPITRKPLYREQVRSALPRLTSLDGAAIRRPPLRLPRAAPSHTFYTTAATTATTTTTTASASVGSAGRRALSAEELDAVMDSLARFAYIWESRRIPWTPAEQRQWARSAAQRPPAELELDEDNFHQRYLHPSAAFTMSVQEDLSFFDSGTMRLAAEVEGDDTFAGMRLSPVDLRDIRVFDVAMKGNSRNLLRGHAAVHRAARDSLCCYTTYRFSVYPERLEVRHNLAAAAVSVVKVTDTRPASALAAEAEAEAEAQAEAGGEKGKKKQKKEKEKDKKEKEDKDKKEKVFAAARQERRPAFFVATLHGVMTWRAPSMRRGECIAAAYDRVVTFVENALPHANAAERRRCAPLLVFNDALHLRPARAADRARLAALSRENVSRFVVEFGVEACDDGPPLVAAVLERATSDAAAGAALEEIVFGSAAVGAEGRDSEVGETGKWKFDIFSLLTSGDAAESAPVPRRVTIAQIDAVVAEMNCRHTIAFANEGAGEVTR